MAFFIFTTHMLTNILLRRLWVAIGWFGVVLLIFLSLIPQPPEIPIDQGDKFGHAFAYAMLMYWWAQLLPAASQRVRVATALLALGIAIEYVQGWTGWRSFDYYDMLADAIGIAFGWLAAAPRPPDLLALLSARARRTS
jgi:VanZ family protein